MGTAWAAMEWQQTTPDAGFQGRDGAGLLAFGGELVQLGGWDPGTSSQVWTSPDGASWTRREDAPWEKRHNAGWLVHNGNVFVIGGDASSGHYQTDVWRTQDPHHAASWSEVTASAAPLASGRVLQMVASLNGNILLFGGQKVPQFVSDTNEMLYHDVWSSPDGSSWTQLTAEAPWAERGGIHGSSVLNGSLFLLGGGTYDTPAYPYRYYYSDVWRSSTGASWTSLGTAPWHPREFHSVAVFDGRLWVLAGWDGTGNRNDVWSSPDGIDWTQLPNTPWGARHDPGVEVFADALWIVAGNLSGSTGRSDAWKLPLHGSVQ